MFSDSNYDSEITISDIWTNIEDGIVFPIGKFFLLNFFSFQNSSLKNSLK